MPQQNNKTIATVIKPQMIPFVQKSSKKQLKKHMFQTKLKSRLHTQPLQTQQSAQDLAQYGQKQVPAIRNNHTNVQSGLKQEEFYQSVCKLQATNFDHHNSTNCLCNSCTCGRHMCKLHIIKPDFPKYSIYQKSFQLRKAKPPVVIYARDYDKLNGPHLDMNTTYHQGFKQREGDSLERPHPEDLIHLEGPVQKLTSYSSEFPGYRGLNQYVKPSDQHIRGKFPLRSKSTYSDTFSAKTLKKDQYKYIKDQLKTGKNWFGTSSYASFFSNPNPEYFAKPVKIVQKPESNPDYKLQYQTTYKNNFVEKGNQQCPAKKYLETRAKGSFSEAKAKFNENSDFKAFSPDFHAISTSKHSYL